MAPLGFVAPLCAASWGWGEDGRLGRGNKDRALEPIRVNGSLWGSDCGQVGVTNISSGEYHACAVLLMALRDAGAEETTASLAKEALQMRWCLYKANYNEL